MSKLNLKELSNCFERLMIAIRITEERPNYQLFENNCQNFAKYLIEFMCPACLTPDTILTVLQRWQDSTIEPSNRIPGAYPASVATISSSHNLTFVTAAETFVSSTDGNTLNLKKPVSPQRHPSRASRPTLRYLPPPPLPPPGEQLTPAELKRFDRLSKWAEKRFVLFISSVWKDIAKNDIPNAYRILDNSLKSKQSNAKTTAQLVSNVLRYSASERSYNIRHMNAITSDFTALQPIL